MEIQLSSGLILDPFRAVVAGLNRAGVSIPENENITHGEKEFKQAFVNACYFADSMTVIGPVAQLVDSAVYNSGWFTSDIGDTTFLLSASSSRNNEFFAPLVQKLREDETDRFKLGGPTTPLSRLPSSEKRILPLFPDVYFKQSEHHAEFDYFLDLYVRAVKRQYSTSFGSSALVETGETYVSGSPVLTSRYLPMLSIMAVVFTFKKPWGPRPASELTSLANWPPMCFFIPMLLPPRPLLSDYSGGLRNRVPLSAWQINPETFNITTYGHPFCTSNVDLSGKTPDVHRAFSEEISRMWSEAAVYSAFNLGVSSENLGVTSLRPDVLVSVEPVGAGRRIRHFNRHARVFRNSHSVVVAENEDSLNTLAEFQAGTATSHFKYSADRYKASSSKSEMSCVFVLPSYFDITADTDLRQWLAPAMGVCSFGHLQSGLSETFAYKGDCDENTACRSNGIVGTFQRRLETEGASIHRRGVVSTMTAPMTFDAEGKPRIFGVSWGKKDCVGSGCVGDLVEMTKYCPESTIQGLADIVKIRRNFNMTDALSASSMNTLSSLDGGSIKKKGKKSVAGEEEVTIPVLFDSEEMI